MTIPNMKRIKVASEEELRGFLTKDATSGARVIIVTHAGKSNTKFIARPVIVEAAVAAGWHAEMSYTLSGGLIGSVISKV